MLWEPVFNLLIIKLANRRTLWSYRVHSLLMDSHKLWEPGRLKGKSITAWVQKMSSNYLPILELKLATMIYFLQQLTRLLNQSQSHLQRLEEVIKEITLTLTWNKILTIRTTMLSITTLDQDLLGLLLPSPRTIMILIWSRISVESWVPTLLLIARLKRIWNQFLTDKAKTRQVTIKL